MKLTHKETGTIFTLYELEKLREFFPDLLPVRDGVVKLHQMVWFRGEEGPEYCRVAQHEQNIRECPEVYSVAEPVYTTKTIYTYED
jgi:hypothetical protein